MYERSYGSKYAEFFTNEDGTHRWRTAAEIAAAIRADIKAAVKAGDLPKEAKYSVTCENYSGGRSINVVVRDLPGAWVPADSEEAAPHRWGVEGNVLSLTAKAVQDKVKEIHGAYNYDGSEAMVDYYDVNYYGDAKIEDEWSADFRARQKAAKAAKKEG